MFLEQGDIVSSLWNSASGSSVAGWEDSVQTGLLKGVYMLFFGGLSGPHEALVGNAVEDCR